MFSEKDFERLWFLYKTEGEPKGVSINLFCISYNIPYTAFYEWFKKTQNLKSFWNQIFAYRNDGEDSMAAERAIDPITIQRKNSLFFGSVKGMQNSAIYNTFIEICKQTEVSFRDYFCRLLRGLKKGRTDYEDLLSMTIYKK